MNLCFDTETTGLPTRIGRGFPNYKNTSHYDSCRLVSISWIVSQQDKVVEQAYYVIKPDGYRISSESQAIHGISQEYAEQNGVDFDYAMKAFQQSLSTCKNLIAHNIEFDSNVMKSEFYRRGMQDMVDALLSKHEICTMKKGKEMMKTKAYPKLAALYKYLYDEDMLNGHNAQFDTYYCFQCYKKLFPVDDRLFFFGHRSVRLTDEQREIVYSDSHKHNLVIACAGSGKTTTTLCRIKHLIAQGVSEDTIMLTTFTRDAANDMKNKLFDIMGYKPDISVGTIDSFAYKYVERYCKDTDKKDVSEYGPRFLTLLKQKPSIVSKFKYVFVDEYQDINETQHEIFKIFVAQGAYLFAVGDDAQNIYSFRNSNIEYILNFQKYYPNSCVHTLTYNFRCSEEIIQMANSCIEKNDNQMPKTMVCGTQMSSKKPHVRYFNSTTDQNQRIVAQIKEYIEQGVDLHEIAVLSPFNNHLFPIEELLTKEGISNVYLDGKADIKSMKKPHHVCLCSIFKSKGLEWDVVIMINMSDDVMPQKKTEKAIEESRRVFYVGITRARKDLYLYYTSTISPYVTRFVSELDRSLYTYHNMTEVCFEGMSDIDFIPNEMSVTKLLENLQGEDFLYMKNTGILPRLDGNSVKITKLYEASDYTPFICKHDLYSDFGIFMEKLVYRMIHEKNIKTTFKDKHVLSCLACVKLDNGLYRVYCQYKHNFKTNMRHTEKYMDDVYKHANAIKRTLEMHSKFIQVSDMPMVCKILQEIHLKANYYDISYHKVPVFSYRFLPDGFQTSMEKSLRHLQDMTNSSVESINQLWHIAKCKKVVTEYRRRMLYMGDMPIEEYEGLYSNLYTVFTEFLKTKGTNVHCEEEYDLKEADGVYGELDIRVDDLVIDIKTSKQDDVSMSWITQLLCYKTLCDFNGKPIRKIGVFNPLRGWYAEMDVSNWTMQKELIQYLLQKKKEKIERLG